MQNYVYVMWFLCQQLLLVTVNSHTKPRECCWSLSGDSRKKLSRLVWFKMIYSATAWKCLKIVQYVLKSQAVDNNPALAKGILFSKSESWYFFKLNLCKQTNFGFHNICLKICKIAHFNFFFLSNCTGYLYFDIKQLQIVLKTS